LAKLVYIGGFGRSGSTLLEYLLTSDPEVVACGEVARHLHKFRARRDCTCGRPAADCPVWGPFQIGRENAKGLDHQTLTLALLKQVSDAFPVMVDSSKTAWGSALVPLRLRRSLGCDFLLVHLVRDPRAVCWSTIRTAPRRRKSAAPSTPAARCLHTIIGWTAANLACEIYGWLHPDSYLRVRYEDLTHAPLKVLAQVLGAVGLQPPANFQVSETVDNRHQLYGNRMRFTAVSLVELREDTAWKGAMPRAYRVIASVLCWPLAARYGYFSRGRLQS
jgi:hypothetical protein